MNMKLTTLLSIGVIASGALTHCAFGTSTNLIFFDDFSSYTSDPGLLSVWQRSGLASSILTNAPDPAVGGTRGTHLVEPAAGHGQLTHLFTGVTPTDASPLVFKFDLYDNNSGTTTGNGFGEIRNSTSTTTTWLDAGLFTTASPAYDKTKYQARNLDTGAWIQLATPRAVGWHTFEFSVRADTVDLRIDGVLDANFSNLGWNGGAFNMVGMGSPLTPVNNTALRFDNVTVYQIVPEPSITMLGALGGLTLAAMVIRRRSSK